MPWPVPNVLGGIDISVCHRATERTEMGSYRQIFLHNFSTLVTFLTGEAWVHSNDLMTSSCGLILKDVEECTPPGVENALGQMMIFHHVGDLKVFHGYVVILFSIAFTPVTYNPGRNSKGRFKQRMLLSA
jgi:hypothetical protein